MNNYLVKADIFRILSRGFSYPSKENMEEIKSIIPELLKSNEADVKFEMLLKSIYQTIDGKKNLQDYSRLFMKGTVSTTESFCCSKLNSNTDVSAFYNAFGMKAKSGESPDTINYQLEFMSLLLVKMNISEKKEQFEVTEDAYKKFLNEHLLEFSEKFYKKLNEAKPIRFYQLLLKLLNILIHDEVGLYDLKNIKQ